MAEVFQPGCVLAPERLPIVAVHVLHVEEVPVAPPHFVKDLLPFLHRHPLHLQVRRGHGLLPLRAVRRGVEQLELALRADKQFRAVVGDGVALVAVLEHRFLAILQRENHQSRPPAGLASVEEVAAPGIQQVPFVGNETAIITRRDRYTRCPQGDALVVDLDDRLLLWLGLLLFGFLLFRDRDFIGLGREGMFGVLLQRERIDLCRLREGKIELVVSDQRVKFTIGEVVEVLALRIPGRIVGGKHWIGDAPDLPVGLTPDMNGPDGRFAGERERQVARIRRPGEVLQLSALLVGHEFFRLVGHRHHEETAFLVRKGDLFRVGRPERPVAHLLAVRGQLHGRAGAVLGHDVEFFFTRKVGNVGDVPAIRRPVGELLVCAGRAGQVPRHAFLDGGRENLAACHEQSPFTLG